MGRQKVIIYTDLQWAAADPIDRMYMHLIEPERWILTQEEDLMLANLRIVWGILCEKSTQMERIKLISEHIAISERTVMRYIQNAQHLFGDILKVDMDLELSLAYQRYMELFEKAKEEKNFHDARRCQENAVLILEKIEARAPVRKKVYAGIIFTDDHEHLQSRLHDAEDAEFQMIDEETRLLEQQTAEVSKGG